MQVPLQITFRNMPVSETVESRIRERADALGKFFPNIVACKVVVESTARSHQKGKLYYLLVDVTVPGKVLVTKRHPAEKHAHEDIYVAVRDAFDEMRRQLEDYADKLKGMVKAHHKGEAESGE
ncbi:MAG: HPF/RaiA family ribosome-associated protein [Stellaceae bacterium]